MLFLVKSLLTLCEQITPFDIDIGVTQKVGCVRVCRGRGRGGGVTHAEGN